MVEQFDYDIHYETICKWWEARKLPIIPLDSLPTFGLIFPDVAAGFLIVTDSNLGIFEFFVSNPESAPETRDAALDLIVEDLLKYGQSLGISNYMADSQIKAVQARAEKFGFKHVGDFPRYYLKARE